jgi:hypothetical protein
VSFVFVEGGRSGARGDGKVSAVWSGCEKVRVTKVAENRYAADSIDLDLVNTSGYHILWSGVRRSRSLSVYFEMTDRFKLSTTFDNDTLFDIPLCLTDTMQLNLQVRHCEKR